MIVRSKEVWRAAHRSGLSASQFGAALGLCGCVVDFINYQREIVGTELEFTGNSATRHGVETEELSANIYEMAFSVQLRPGGFFMHPTAPLGASPDRLVEGPDDHPTRILEIKSPFHSLHDGRRPECQPFGIPQQYMCQMQGQMALSGAAECDFFVYLSAPELQIVAWRVRKSDQFWAWAFPKLMLVSEYIHCGPPDGVDRSFSFGAFPFDQIEVLPLIPPTNLSRFLAIRKPSHFPFFFNPIHPTCDVLKMQSFKSIYALKLKLGDVVLMGVSKGGGSGNSDDDGSESISSFSVGEIVECPRIQSRPSMRVCGYDSASQRVCETVVDLTTTEIRVLMRGDEKRDRLAGGEDNTSIISCAVLLDEELLLGASDALDGFPVDLLRAAESMLVTDVSSNGCAVSVCGVAGDDPLRSIVVPRFLLRTRGAENGHGVAKCRSSNGSPNGATDDMFRRRLSCRCTGTKRGRIPSEEEDCRGGVAETGVHSVGNQPSCV